MIILKLIGQNMYNSSFCMSGDHLRKIKQTSCERPSSGRKLIANTLLYIDGITCIKQWTNYG